MSRLKLLSAVLAVLLAGYVGVSAVLFNRLHNEIDSAGTKCRDLESRCKLLESERDQLAKQLSEKRPAAGGTLEQVQESLQFKETELAELSNAYEALQTDYDALQERLHQTPGADLPPETVERFRRFRGRFGDRPFSLEEMQQRRQERLQGVFDTLQEGIDNAPDENAQQNLMQIADSVSAMDELRQQMRDAADDEARGEIRSALREEGENLRRLVREERDLELANVARQFGIDEPGRVQELMDAIETVNNSPVQRLSRFGGGMAFGGRRGRGR